MERNSSLAKNQHYVPQFILRNFTINCGNQIFVFDKRKENSFKTNIRNIAAESGFYNFYIKGYHFTIEPGLAEFEWQTGQAFEKIIKDRSISNLKEEDRAKIAAFVSVQIYRTRYFRDRLFDMSKWLSEISRRWGAVADNEDNPDRLIEANIKDVSIKMILKDSEDLIPIIMSKEWMIYETNESDPFYISDNPIVLQNHRDFGPFWGNLGLAVPGIEIYFPLTKNLTLAMLCPSHSEMFKDVFNKVSFLEKVVPGFEKQFAPGELQWMQKLKEGYEKGNAVPMEQETVVNINSLQVMWSSRFVFSNRNDFNLVLKMIAADPSYKEGFKPEFS
jgi:hypothetical protein